MKQVAALVTFVILTSPRSVAQSSSDATIQALLAEVRQLRIALEKSTTVIPRIQATLQRVQLQQDVVARMSRELDVVRNELAKFKTDAAGRAEHAAEIEARAQQELDPVRRKSMEDEAKRIKGAAIGLQRDSQLVVNEIEIRRRLEIEESKLRELDDRLNALERTLEPAPSR
jgi:hypothetical protein